MKFTIKKLPEICEIKTGKRDANHATQNGKYRFYTCANQYSFCDTFSFSGKSVIVPGNGDIGLVFYYDGEFEAYQRTYVLQNISIDAKYLYYHLLYKWRHINSGKQYGSTVRYVRMSNFTSYTIPVPSEDEQKRIVAKIEELFSELDNGVETLKKTKQQLAVYRQAVLKEAFDIKDSEKVESILDSVLKVLTDYHANGSYEILKENVTLLDTPNYAIMVRSTNYEKNDFENDVKYINKHSYDFLKKSQLFGGEVLMGKIGNAGKVYFVKPLGKPMSLAMNMFAMRFNDKIDSKYVYYYLLSPDALQNIKKYVKGVGTPTIDKKSVRALKIVYPTSIEKQKNIVNEIEARLSVCDSIEQTVNTALQQAEAMRQSILKKAFEGEL